MASDNKQMGPWTSIFPRCILLIFLVVLNCSAVLCQVVPIHTICNLPGFDYFNLTASLWYLQLNETVCVPPTQVNDLHVKSPCILYFAFCHRVDEIGPCHESSVCQASGAANFSLGSYSENPFVSGATNTVHGFQASFDNGDTYISKDKKKCKLKTLITLKCDKKAKWPVRIPHGTSARLARPPQSISYNNDSCEMNLVFGYAGACQSSYNGSSLSPGVVVLLVFFISFMLYLAIGAMLNAAKGRKGLEIVPHFTFWSMVPSYIWNGCKLVICCNKRQSSSGYSAI